MLNFQPLTLGQLPLLRPILDRQQERICDDTIGGVFLWRDYFRLCYALEGGSLFLRAQLPDSEQTVYSVPMGDAPLAALDALHAHCRAQGQPLCLSTVPEPTLALLRTRYACAQIEEESDWADYLYAWDDLANLPGKKYAGKRNHVSRFLREYENWAFEPITAQNLPAVAAFYERFSAGADKDSETFREDERKVREVLGNYALYGFEGGALTVDGEVVGMAIGEVRDDTLFVHIEKADIAYHGAYQMLVTHLPRLLAREGLRYVNREDDAGDEGLRRSKLSYHPVALLKKYKVCCPL